MYYVQLETKAGAMKKHNELLMLNAADRRKGIAARNKVNKAAGVTAQRAECAANRSAQRRLEIRIKDWERTINDPANRSKVMTGYNKPGSLA